MEREKLEKEWKAKKEEEALKGTPTLSDFNALKTEVKDLAKEIPVIKQEIRTNYEIAR